MGSFALLVAKIVKIGSNLFNLNSQQSGTWYFIVLSSFVETKFDKVKRRRRRHYCLFNTFFHVAIQNDKWTIWIMSTQSSISSCGHFFYPQLILGKFNDLRFQTFRETHGKRQKGLQEKIHFSSSEESHVNKKGSACHMVEIIWFEWALFSYTF